MATLVLGAIGSALGAGFGGTILGLSGAAIGGLIGSTVGTAVDSLLFARTITQDGPRLNEISVTSSAEGQTVKRIWGRVRIGGNVIWATNFKEKKNTTKQGGKGGGGGVETTEYTYSMSFAIAFCEGHKRVSLGRVWADGKLLDTEKLDMAFYPGSRTQNPDPTMEGVEGTGNVPAYRGVCYLVFKDLNLADFGNRMPQITAEIIKPLEDVEPDSMEDMLEAINLIPSTGEAAYATTPTVRDDGFGNAVPENVNLSATATNIANSLADLTKQLPNNKAVNLVVAWFGDDLRLGFCKVKPKVEAKTGRELLPQDWVVNGLTRSSIYVDETSRVDGNPAFGGTPTDTSVVEAIKQLANVENQDVYFYPFLLMDIPAGNTLTDPYTGSTGQPVYPWRGRITTNTLANDKTAAAQTQVNSFFGSVTRTQFNASGTVINYTGSPTDFGYRRMILHYAHLCAAAALTLTNPAKFKAFYIGTELRGLTSVRSSAASAATASTTFPGVNALVTLLQDVRLVFNSYGLTGVKLSYAADWSEYHSYRPSDGSNDVYFNMDALWGHPSCDYVAIDNYMPLSDWRDGTAHADYGSGNVTAHATTGTFGHAGFPRGTSMYDKTYLAGQVEGGEGYDYFYASDADRTSQTRTTIVDGAHAEHWVFRQKDFRNWWAQTHRSRPGGVRDAAVTALNGPSGPANTWTASGKKVAFSEFGAPAVDKGMNQPNVFYDPKSSESFLPYFSSGARDDQCQRVYYEVVTKYWRDNAPTVGSVKLVDKADMFAWTWDVRPYPAFPFRNDIWSDAANYTLGHWLTGRVGVITLGQLVKELCAIGGLDPDLDVLVTGLVNSNAIVRGFVVDNLASPRGMLGPLMETYLFDGFESEGKIKFELRSNTFFTPVDLDDLVVDNSDPGGYSLTRAQETELPAAASVTFIDEENDYQNGSAGGVRVVGSSRSVTEIRVPLVLDQSFARALGEVLIQQAWTGRDRGEFRLPPSFMRLDPGDGIEVSVSSRLLRHRLEGVERSEHLSLRTMSHDVTVYDQLTFNGRTNTSSGVPVFGRTVLYVLDIPLVSGAEPSPWAPRIAAYQAPFPSAVEVYRDEGTTLTLNTALTRPAALGATTASYPKGSPWTFLYGTPLSVKVYDPEQSLLSVTEGEVLNGANAFAVRGPSGTWEVMQFTTATLTGVDNGLPVYDLNGIIRGQLGTETEIADPLPAGSQFCLLEPEVLGYLDIPNSQKTFALDYRYGPAGTANTSAFFQDLTYTGLTTGLLPYAPVHLTRSDSGGDVTFSWIRRTRFNGDDWEAEEVPLNEESERYDVEIWNMALTVLRRTVANVTSPSYTYTAAQQTADGGALAQYTIRVWQKSASVGRGRMAQATL